MGSSRPRSDSAPTRPSQSIPPWNSRRPLQSPRRPGIKTALFALAVALGAPAAAQVYYVDDSAAGANDGTSWQDAFTDLQSALAVAGPSDEIWVATGVYKPSASLDRSATFEIDCAVYGGFDGTETSLAARAGLFDQTILSGDLLGNDGPDFAGNEENSAHVATVPDVLFALSLLDGFTIQGGNADLSAYPGRSGGGLWVAYFAFWAVARNCTFRGNYASGAGGAIASQGKGPLTIERCTILGNRSRFHAGGVAGGAGTLVKSSFFLGNRAGTDGGGLYFADTAVDCVFSGNIAGGAGGGAVYTASISGCTFSANTATTAGGFRAGFPWSLYPVSNSILWGNDDATGSTLRGQIGGNLRLDDCVVEGWDGSIPGAGTIGSDPLFQSPLGPDGIAGTLDDDLGLRRGSPCVDTANGWAYPGLGIDALGRDRYVDSLACDDLGSLDLDRGAIERQVVDGATEFCDATPSSLGLPARIGGDCIARISDGPFRVSAQPVPDGRAFLLVGSPGPAQPFGDGNLCLSGSFASLGPVAPSGGSAMFAIDPAQPPASQLFVPGASIGLQVLFRDPAAGGTGFNLSSAMQFVALP